MGVTRDDIRNLVNTYPAVNRAMGKGQLEGLLWHLQCVLDAGIEGDIVELGCNKGTSAMFIRRLLDLNESTKEFHVYDSWQGLPPRHAKDAGSAACFQKGSMTTPVQTFVENHTQARLRLPHIHSGWFKDIPDAEYPDKICFAFFDGDFYSSIIDSFEKVYNKVLPGGRIVIDDCGWENLPGVLRACNEFLVARPETLTLDAYAPASYGGLIIKL